MRSFGVTIAALMASACLAGCSEPSAPTLEAGSTFADCEDGCPEMVVIPAGEFMMGGEGGEEGRPEWPVHPVTIAKPFALGVMEVTVAQYSRFIDESGHTPSVNCRAFDPEAFGMSSNLAGTYLNPGPGAGDGQDSMPASCISWMDAKAYVAWLSGKTGKAYRLPSEAEWEYAARAGSATDYAWGDKAEGGCSVANTLDEDGHKAWFGTDKGAAVQYAQCSDGFAGAAPVGSLDANAFGLHDMIGNVWEWTEDCYIAPYPEDTPTDQTAYFSAEDCARHAVRGGSWITEPFRNRPAWRGRDPVDQVSWIFGMRVARDLTEDELP